MKKNYKRLAKNIIKEQYKLEENNGYEIREVILFMTNPALYNYKMSDEFRLNKKRMKSDKLK